jgi:hypothetical protein
MKYIVKLVDSCRDKRAPCALGRAVIWVFDLFPSSYHNNCLLKSSYAEDNERIMLVFSVFLVVWLQPPCFDRDGPNKTTMQNKKPICRETTATCSISVWFELCSFEPLDTGLTA